MKNSKIILHALLLLIGLLSFNTQAGVEITYMHNDALGSAVAGTDEQGNVKWRSHYQPYGTEMLGQRGASGVRSGYTGHRDDPDSGLTYMGARYYSPSIGRFMGIDPVGVSESNQHSFNRYTYANNNPYKYVDPDGESPVLALERALWAGGRVGAGVNVAVHHIAGVTLSTMLANAAWNILHNESSDDDKPVIIDDSTKTEDKVKNATNSGDQDLIDEETYKEKTMKKSQNKRRKRQREFLRGGFEGNYDDFLKDIEKNN